MSLRYRGFDILSFRTLDSQLRVLVIWSGKVVWTGDDYDQAHSWIDEGYNSIRSLAVGETWRGHLVPGGDDTEVDVTRLDEYTYRCEQLAYYWRHGRLELIITQPVERVMETFRRLLEIDTELQTDPKFPSITD